MKRITFKNQRFKNLICRGHIKYLCISIFNKKFQLLSNPFSNNISLWTQAQHHHKMFICSFFFVVVQSCPTLCNLMDCSTQGCPVLHHLPEFAQIHAHWVSDAIKPSHPLPSLLLLPSIFRSIRVFSNESALRIRWPKYWSFSFSISPFNEYSGWISFRIDWFDLLIVQLSRVFSNTTV